MLNDQKMENNPMGAPLPEPFTVNQSQMSPSPAVLRGFWRLFADAWHSYWPHFWTFVKINLLLVILILVPILAVTSVVILRLAGMSAIIIGVILGIILLAIVILFIIRLLVANVVLTCRVAAGKEVIAVSQLLKIARHNVGKIIGVAILVGLAVIIGQILFVIPGLIFMTWFALPMFVVVFEDLGVIKSMSRSYNLVQGYGWETFYLIAGITLLTGLLSSLVQIIGIAGFAFGSVGGMMMGGESTGLIVGFGVAILSALFFACLISLLTPIWGIMPALRYLDLKHIKDNNLPKTESTAKAVTISLILVLIWVPLVVWSMWANYQDLTGKKVQSLETNTRFPTSESTGKIQPQEKAIETKYWRTYIDNEYGLSFKYPPEWMIQEAARNDKENAIFVFPVKEKESNDLIYHFYIEIKENNEKLAEQYVDDLLAEFKRIEQRTGNPTVNYEAKKEVILGGNQGIKLEKMSSMDTIQDRYYVVNRSRLFIIQIPYQNPILLNPEINSKIANQILSTFQFTK